MSTSLSLVRLAGFVMFALGLPFIVGNPLPSNDLLNAEGDEGLCAEWAADETGCAQFYSCVSHRSQCRSVRNSIASQMCNRVNALQPDEERLEHNAFINWAQRTNRCVVQRLSRQFAQDDVIYGSNRRACTATGDRIRSAMTWCARLQNNVSDGDECKAILVDGRQMALALVGRNWMWLVEMMSACPRDVVNSFIRWAMNNTSH